MSTELKMLVLSGLLSLVLAILTIVIHFRRYGGKMIRGNRDNYPVVDGLAARVLRAHASLNEALLPFAIMVFAGETLRASNLWISCASIGFFIARLSHAGCYLLGSTPWRSLSYYAGLLSTLVVATQLLLFPR